MAIAVSLAVMSLGTFQGGLESLGEGGLGLTPNITLQMALTLGGGILIAAACVRVPRTAPMPLWGIGAAIAALVLAGYTALSVAWSVDPANSWLEASRSFAYAATFAGAIALVRLASSRWRSVLAGVLLATVAISAYALAAKIIPESLDSSDAYARLSLPFGYWNAVGLTAALGIPPCLWLGARREGHGVVGALAAPMLCGLLITLMLSVSRGALAAALIGTGLWFAFVPLRLRALALLAIAGATAAVTVAYAYSKGALSNDYVGLGPRATASASSSPPRWRSRSPPRSSFASPPSAARCPPGAAVRSASRRWSRWRSCRSRGSARWRTARAGSSARSATPGTTSPTPTRSSRRRIRAA